MVPTHSLISKSSCVAYWPSTEPSIKRFTCVNKQKKQVHPIEDIGILSWSVDVVEFGEDAYAHRKLVDFKQLYNQVPLTIWVSSVWVAVAVGDPVAVPVEDKMPEWEPAPDRGLGPSVTLVEQPSQNVKEVLLWSEELGVTMWQSVSVSISPLTHNQHQPFRNPFENKVLEVYFYICKRIVVSWLYNTCTSTKHLVTVPSEPSTIGITVTFMFYIFFIAVARSSYLSLFSRSFSFTLWSGGRAKSMNWQVLFFLFFFTGSGRLANYWFSPLFTFI